MFVDDHKPLPMDLVDSNCYSGVSQKRTIQTGASARNAPFPENTSPALPLPC